jgi:Ca2+-binding EF-hand superfamily protein
LADSVQDHWRQVVAEKGDLVMPISSITMMGGEGHWDRVRFKRHEPSEEDLPRGLTKDKLVARQTKLKAKGRDTTQLDKVLDNFETLDTNQDSRLSFEELKAGASTLGIQLPSKDRQNRSSSPEQDHERPQDHRMPFPKTKDQLTQIIEQMKADGRDTANIEKIMQNFDKLDVDHDNQVSFQELRDGAEEFGIELKIPNHPRGAHDRGWTKPALPAGGASLVSQMIAQFKTTDPSASSDNDPLFVSVSA